MGLVKDITKHYIADSAKKIAAFGAAKAGASIFDSLSNLTSFSFQLGTSIGDRERSVVAQAVSGITEPFKLCIFRLDDLVDYDIYDLQAKRLYTATVTHESCSISDVNCSRNASITRKKHLMSTSVSYILAINGKNIGIAEPFENGFRYRQNDWIIKHHLDCEYEVYVSSDKIATIKYFPMGMLIGYNISELQFPLVYASFLPLLS